jgi:hypothetical protein
MQSSEDIMQLSNEKRFNDDVTINELIAERDRLIAESQVDSDFASESVLDHIYANPLGRLLRVISTLPEVRSEKVEHARQLIHETEDQLDYRMDLALDKVLEELITEN